MGKYRAFLSYCHRDAKIVRKIHAKLERWPIDKSLAGRETPVGAVPCNLRPIFRDRDDFAGGSSLADATRQALEASDFLVVACSPAAARSTYVNEEVRLFKTLGRADRVIPIILDGEPGDPERECFPDAVRYEIGPDGALTSNLVEPIAADARDQGDGLHRATAKVVAALLGLPFDEIAKRAELVQRRRMRLIVVWAVVMFLLAMTASFLAWYADRKRAEAERNAETARSTADTVMRDVGLQLAQMPDVDLTTVERIFESTNQVYGRLLQEQPDAPELRERKAVMLGAFALAHMRRGAHEVAEESMRESVALMKSLRGVGHDPRSTEMQIARTHVGLGFLVQTRNVEEADRLFRSAIETLDDLDADDPLDLDGQAARIEAVLRAGGLALQIGEFASAYSHADRGVVLGERLLLEGPTSVQAHAGSGGARLLRAEIHAAGGEHAETIPPARDAVERYRAALDLAPGRQDYRVSLARAHEILGAALDAIGDRGGAEVAWRREQRLRSRRVSHAEADPKVLSTAASAAYEEAKYNRKARDYERAARLARESAGLRERVVALRPEDANLRYAYALALGHICQVLLEAEDYVGVLAVALEELSVLDSIADAYQFHTLHLASTKARIGIARQMSGDLRMAFQDYLEAQRLFTRAAREERVKVEALDRYGDLLSRQLHCVRELKEGPDLVAGLRETYALWTGLAARDSERRRGLAMVAFSLGILGDEATSRWREVVAILKAIGEDRELTAYEADLLRRASDALAPR